MASDYPFGILKPFLKFIRQFKTNKELLNGKMNKKAFSG
jgi:hypothetical protein